MIEIKNIILQETFSFRYEILRNEKTLDLFNFDINNKYENLFLRCLANRNLIEVIFTLICNHRILISNRNFKCKCMTIFKKLGKVNTEVKKNRILNNIEII